MSHFSGKRVWIVGASEGIGNALAMRLSQRGARLILSARSELVLARLAQTLDSAAHVEAFDVVDAQKTRDVAERVFAAGPVDSVIYLPALYHPMRLDALDLDIVAQMFQVNTLGAFHFVAAVFPLMKRAGCGQLALCASPSGYRGLPKGQPYGATKAAVINLAQSLRVEAKGTGVDVRLINPGFINTRLTQKNDFKMPALMEPEDAAKRIEHGLASGRFDIHFPKRFTLGLKLLAHLPDWLYFRLFR